MKDHEVRKFMRLFEQLTKDVGRIADALELRDQQYIEDLEALGEIEEGGNE